MPARLTIYFIVLITVILHVSAVFAAELAGLVTRTRGETTAVNNGQLRPLALNAEVFVGDNISTGANARTEVRFHDGSVVTLGQQTVFSVREYHHDEGDEKVHAIFELIDGAFRSVTSKVFKMRPNNIYEVRTAIAVIGVRGTDFWGGHDKGFLEIALLDGTGVYVENKNGRVEMTAPGQGTDVKTGEAPTTPKIWAAPRVERALKTVSWD